MDNGAGLFCFALLTGTAAPAMAQETLAWRVEGVAPGDRLMIRAEPSPSAAVLGSLPPDAAPVELIETTGSGAAAWGRIGLPEGAGWVAMRFLAPLRVETMAEGRVPVGLVCAGTEPFWTLTVGIDRLAFAPMEGANRSAALDEALADGNDRRSATLIASGDSGRFTLALARRAGCSDGMSDRPYGWWATLLDEPAGGAAKALSGCCHLPGPPVD